MSIDQATSAFRPLRRPDDYPGVAAANQAGRESAGRPSGITAADMARYIEHLVNTDLERDVQVVEIDGRIVGYSIVSWRDLVEGERIFVVHRILDPAARGHGIEERTLAWTGQRMRATAAALADRPPTRATTFTWSDDEAGARLLAERGWAEDARSFEMVRPSLDAIPELPLPAGFELRPLGHGDGPRLWEALVDAFRDHRNKPEATTEDRERFLGNDDQDPDLWVIAFDGDEIAGGVVNLVDAAENARLGRELGYVEAVFTRPAWRRRGLARSLVAHSLALLRDRGMTCASLLVDGANPNQAMTLYEDLGFEVASTETEWSIAVEDIP